MIRPGSLLPTLFMWPLIHLFSQYIGRITQALIKLTSKFHIYLLDMAASMMSSAAVVGRSAAPQASMVAPRSSGFPVTRKANTDVKSLGKYAGKVRCMKVWPPLGLKKFETLSYLPPLSQQELAKEVDYLLRSGWVPCLEFELEKGFVYRDNHKSPGYYDGRYWTMWKLPMYGCTDSSQVLKEVEECKKEYPTALIRIIGFDNKRQVQCISFIAFKPPGY